MSLPPAPTRSPSSNTSGVPSPSSTDRAAVTPWTPAPIQPTDTFDTRAAALWGQTYGLVNATDESVEDRLLRIAALVPMALEIVDEARATIVRLRTENEALHRRLDEA